MVKEYSDKMEAIDLEWKASYTKLKAKLHLLEKNITFINTNVHQRSLVQPNRVMEDDNNPQNTVLLFENQRKVYDNENFEKYKCEQCNIGFLKRQRDGWLPSIPRTHTWKIKLMTSLFLRIKLKHMLMIKSGNNPIQKYFIS